MPDESPLAIATHFSSFSPFSNAHELEMRLPLSSGTCFVYSIVFQSNVVMPFPLAEYPKNPVKDELI